MKVIRVGALKRPTPVNSDMPLLDLPKLVCGGLRSGGVPLRRESAPWESGVAAIQVGRRRQGQIGVGVS